MRCRIVPFLCVLIMLSINLGRNEYMAEAAKLFIWEDPGKVIHITETLPAYGTKDGYVVTYSYFIKEGNREPILSYSCKKLDEEKGPKCEPLPTPKPKQPISSLDSYSNRYLSYGSGVVISKDGHVLTNHHVIEACPRPMVLLEGTMYDVVVVNSDAKKDLALLETPCSLGKFAKIRQSPPIKLGEHTVVLGYPLIDLLDASIRATSGIVSAQTGIHGDKQALQTSAPVQPGNSGGALLDGSANLIGIVTYKTDDMQQILQRRSIAQNVNFAMNIDTIMEFLNSQNIQPERSTTMEDLRPEDIAEIGQGFTVLVACYAQ